LEKGFSIVVIETGSINTNKSINVVIFFTLLFMLIFATKLGWGNSMFIIYGSRI